MHRPPARRGRIAAAVAVLLAVAISANPAAAARLTLKDGRTIEGRIARLSSMVDNPDIAKPAEGVVSQLIVLVDDDLRRTFIPKIQIAAVDEKDSTEGEEHIAFKQPVAHNGPRVASVGPIVEITPFDEFGRRTLKMIGSQGVEAVIQGVTLLTPHWAKVEALQLAGRPLQWEERIATSSIPPATLDQILSRVLDPKRLDQRLTVVRFYLQSERYRDAEERLKKIIEDFPEGKAQYQPTVIR
ncbi:MAG TPA: peptidase, partial [Pirellulales bacterium]|nr:peptidase [Pirellulales bacterium]